VAAPVLAGNEHAYVLDCLQSTWISGHGAYVGRFEAAFRQFCSAEHAVSCSTGTAALHLALLALNVGADDEVLVPALTFVATANAVAYCGAHPRFVDAEPTTWNLDPSLLAARITRRTKGIIVVHLYGHPVDMAPVLSVARRHGLFVIEDASEAHGAQYRGRPVGTLGDAATFSFAGNKTLTTGEGGMVVTGDPTLAANVRRLKTQGMDPHRRYWFSSIGFNYQLTNVAAAIGLAQLEMAGWHVQRRRQVASWYREALEGVQGITLQAEQPWARHAYWMVTLLVDEALGDRDVLMARLAEHGIETRPVFYPLHTLPPYRSDADRISYPVADRIARTGLSLPTWGGLTREDVTYVVERLRECLRP
jgi:perosamine synthetase